MAEGILRTAHNVYTDKVQQIVALSGGKVNEEAQDKYAEFKNITNNYYPTLDEAAEKEMEMYVDLYEALRELYGLACEQNDEVVKTETASHLNELLAIVQRQVKPDMEVAQEAAGWLNYVTEAVLQTWNVSNTTGFTINGDVPQMAKNAKQNPTLASLGDQYGDTAPVSDGKNVGKKGAEEMRNNAWGNVGGNDTWPSLNNPYVPKPFGDYTMKGEKGVDKDGDTTLDPQNGDTYPSLKNPYVPQPVDSVFKMKEKDLIVDK
jgi:hypothetical protein